MTNSDRVARRSASGRTTPSQIVAIGLGTCSKPRRGASSHSERRRASSCSGLAMLMLAWWCGGRGAAADELPPRITIGTWNLEWFYDHYRGDNQSDLAKQMSAPSPEEWQWRLETIGQVVAEMNPTILALQEVENRDVVYRLCRHLEERYQLKYRIAFIPGYDFFTEQQVCLIYQSGLVAYTRREQSSEMFASDEYRNVQKHLFADFEWGSGADLQRLKLVNVHFKATPESADIRQRQARLIRHWLEADLAAGVHVVALGDFNSEEFYGREQAGCEMLILRQPTPESTPLHDLTQFLSPERQFTHMIDRAFDRILVSPNLKEDEPERRDLVFTTIRNYREAVIRGEKDLDHRDVYYQIPQAERDVSDHYPLLAEFVVQ